MTRMVESAARRAALKGGNRKHVRACGLNSRFAQGGEETFDFRPLRSVGWQTTKEFFGRGGGLDAATRARKGEGEGEARLVQTGSIVSARCSGTIASAGWPLSERGEAKIRADDRIARFDPLGVSAASRQRPRICGRTASQRGEPEMGVGRREVLRDRGPEVRGGFAAAGQSSRT